MHLDRRGKVAVVTDRVGDRRALLRRDGGRQRRGLGLVDGGLTPTTWPAVTMVPPAGPGEISGIDEIATVCVVISSMPGVGHAVSRATRSATRRC
jgi:hypothetical protein